MMGDLKSKLPDLKELGEIGGKLFKDLKTSVSEIITTYKKKHPSEKPTKAAATATKKEQPVKKTKATAAPKEGKAKKDK
jgi:hypothetical protein